MLNIAGVVRNSNRKLLKGIPVSNGEDIVLTNAKGRFQLSVDPELHSFIFATRPDGCTGDGGWYAPTPHNGGGVELVLEMPERRPSSTRTPFIGHITDVHLYQHPHSQISRGVLTKLLRDIHQQRPDLELVIATGDLTECGDVRDLRILRRVFAASPVPVIAMFGGHDGISERKLLKTALPHIRHWEQIMGPTYFSFELGCWHVIDWSEEDLYFGPERTAMKRRWLEADMSRAKGKRILLAQHCPPEKEWVEELARYGVEVLVFGHWHTSKCYEHAGVLVLGTPSFCLGGIDMMPGGFRTIELPRGKPRTGYVTEDKKHSPKAIRNSSFKISWRSSARTCLSRGQAIVRDGDVYVPLSDEEYRGRAGVLCLDTNTGKKKWRAPAEHSVRGTLAASDKSVFAVTQPGEILALNRSSGKLSWSRKLEGFPDRWIHTGPLLAEGLVIAGTGGGGIQTFDMRTGTPRWRWVSPGEPSDIFPHYTTPIVIGDTVAVMVHRKGVSCLKVKTGRLKWHYDAPYEWFYAPMILAQDKMFVPGFEHYYAADSVTGEHIWARRVYPGQITSWSCDEELLVLNRVEHHFADKSTKGKFVIKKGVAQCRSAKSGRILWEREYGKDLADIIPYRRSCSQGIADPILTPQAVYTFGLDGRVRALDRKTGKTISTLDLGEAITATAWIDNHSLLATTYPGSVIRIQV